MAHLIPKTLDFTAKDRAAFLARANALLDSVFPSWTERDRANFGNLLLNFFGHVVDLHSKYGDNMARESRISTAQLRRSLLGLIKLIDYTAEGASAASTTETFTLSAALAGTLTITAGSIVKTRSISNPISFQLLDDLVFAPGELTKSGTVENSETHVEQLVSSGLPDQQFKLRRSPFLQDSDSPDVTFANGDYSVIQNFLDSDSSDRHVVVLVDADDRATLVFGDGINGAIPQGSGSVTYKTGGGDAGNVEPNSLVVLEGSFSDNLGNIASITVDNASEASGGGPRQSNAQIRIEAPRAARVLNRAVAREDYEIVAEQVPGVARALHLTAEEDPGVGENSGILWIIPVGGGTASQDLLDEVRGKFEQVTGQPEPTTPHLNTFRLTVLTAAYQTIDHTIRGFPSEGHTSQDMKTAIDNALEKFYGEQIAASDLLEIAPAAAMKIGVTSEDGDSLIENPLVNFGFYFKDASGGSTDQLAWSDVFNVVRDLDEVRKLDADDGLLLNGLRADVDLDTFRFPVVGTVTVIDGDTGQTVT